jgi:hypothetical protein
MRKGLNKLYTFRGYLAWDSLTRRIAERSIKVADEAAKTITAETGKSAGLLPRAA